MRSSAFQIRLLREKTAARLVRGGKCGGMPPASKVPAQNVSRFSCHINHLQPRVRQSEGTDAFMAAYLVVCCELKREKLAT